MRLTKYQETAIEKFKKQKVAALFMEMGTGKTRTAVELANMHDNKYDLVLWLAPVSTLANANVEIKKWGGFNNPVLFRGYESIASSDNIYLDLLSKLKDKRVFMICDESLFLKNGSTKRWRRAKRIRDEFAEFCIIMNGTPMSRDEFDIYWQMELLSPLIFDMNEREFESTIFKKFRKVSKRKKKREWRVSCQKNLPWLKSRIEPYVFECELDLPVVLQEDCREYRLSAYTMDEYTKKKREFLEAVKNDDDFMILAILSEMKYIVACDRLKNDAIAEDIVDKRCIVFCEYREEMDRICRQLDYNVFSINGETPLDDRDYIISGWSESNKPLVMTIGCGAFGLNLQASNDVRFASLPWDYAKYSQALHRVYRLGQDANCVSVTKYKQRIGIMKLVDECLWRKTSLAKMVKDMDWREYGLQNI